MRKSFLIFGFILFGHFLSQAQIDYPINTGNGLDTSIEYLHPHNLGSEDTVKGENLSILGRTYLNDNLYLLTGGEPGEIGFDFGYGAQCKIYQPDYTTLKLYSGGSVSIKSFFYTAYFYSYQNLGVYNEAQLEPRFSFPFIDETNHLFYFRTMYSDGITRKSFASLEYDSLKTIVVPDGFTFKTDTLWAKNLSDSGVLSSGDYTPALTHVANIDSSTTYPLHFLRVAKEITVSGQIDFDPALTATQTKIRISLPIASNFTSTSDCGGSGFAWTISGQGFAIRGDTINDAAELIYTSSDTTRQEHSFSFIYQIK